MKRKWFLGFTMMAMVLIGWTITAAAEEEIAVYVNEEVMQCDISPYMEQDRVMVPMRKIFEALHAEVMWSDATQTITAHKGEKEIVLTIGDSTMRINGKSEVLDVVPVVVENTTFVPLRAVSQALDADVKWNDFMLTAYIDSPYSATIVTMYSISGETLSLPQSGVELYKSVGWYLEPVVTMYAEDGRSQIVLQSEINANLSVGWYLEPIVTMYAVDGRTQKVPQSEVEANLGVGWYLEPVVIMYAKDGRSQAIPQSEVKASLGVGWYLEPFVTMYAMDGRTLAVPKSEVEAYQGVGWYRTKAGAQAAEAAERQRQYEEAQKVSSSHSNRDGVYRTPKGKRYHFDADCGGKNSYPITMQKALNAGLTPCAKCAY